MVKYQRSNIHGKYHILEVFECPIDVILYAANFGSENVTIENHSHFGKTTSTLLNISCKNLTLIPKLKRYVMDFEITKSEFTTLKSVWDSNGCYAIFHDLADLKFKASELNDIARYKALDNFNWTLELAIPGSASDGWGHIASPDIEIINKTESYMKTISNKG